MLLLGAALPAQAASESQPEDDLFAMSLDDLMEVELVSIGKRAQRVDDIPAAVFVLTGDEIRRSGVTSIPEALRLVPGVQVARRDANSWAISIRGFQSLGANKLLVMIDGRSIYAPAFGGVIWDYQDVVLEDIDRIEVIRGPGASIWGANAVNGVINIVTKDSAATRGVYGSGLAGTEDRFIGEARFGGSVGETLDYRVYAKRRDVGSQASFGGIPANDGLRDLRTGFRVDAAPSERDALTFTGEIFKAELPETKLVFSEADGTVVPAVIDSEANGGHLLGRWTRDLEGSGEIKVQAYYDKSYWENGPFFGISADTDTFDLELDHQFDLGERHSFLWGVGYRLNRIDFTTEPYFSVGEDREDHLFSAFLQDEITLIEDSLFLTIGSKFEHNSYSGFEVQPTLRLLGHVADGHTLWTGVSRAVRTPTAAEQDFASSFVLTDDAAGPMPIALDFNSDPDTDSEKLTSFEAGYRFNAFPRFSLDVSAFYNLYDDLVFNRVVDFGFVGFPPVLRVEALTENAGDATSYGFELAANYDPLSWWRLRGSYSLVKTEADVTGGSELVISNSVELTPEQQALVRSSMDLGSNVELDLTGRYVSGIEAGGIDGYVGLDARLGWRPRDFLELSIGGQNLLHSDHLEYGTNDILTVPTKVERSVYGRIAVRF